MGGAEEEQAVRHPVLLQRWATMTFLHWAYDPALVRPLVPGGLDLELFDGAAWVGLAAFEMARVRVPGLPPVPRLSRFPETNLRTYVRGPDGGGVWFLSLDAASLPVVLGGRAAYGVPYHYADMSVEVAGDTVRYRSRRRPGGHGHDIVVAAGQPYGDAEVTGFDRYLTDRWLAYGRRCGHFVVTRVEHPPWPLSRGRLVRLRQSLTAAAGMPEPAGSPLVHYSPGVDVRLAAPRLVRRAGETTKPER